MEFIISYNVGYLVVRMCELLISFGFDFFFLFERFVCDMGLYILWLFCEDGVVGDCFDLEKKVFFENLVE